MYGPSPQGYAPQGPYSPPAKRNTGLIVAILGAGAAILILIAAVGYVMLKPDDPKTPAVTPQAKAAAAVASLKSSPGLHYTGTIEAGGEPVQADLSVTRSGSIDGSLTIGGEVVDLIMVDGTAYVKAPSAYWRNQPGASAAPQDFADRWSRAPASIADLDLDNLLTPAVMSDSLGKSQPLLGPSGSPDPASAQVVGSQRTITLDGTYGQFYVSELAPYKLLRVKSDSNQLDVAELPATEVDGLFTTLKDKVKDLAGALDPDASVAATQPKNVRCSVSSCTIEARATRSNSGKVRLILKGVIHGDTRTGKILGTCEDTETLDSGKSVTLSCKISGGAWSKWARAIKPGKSGRYYLGGTRVTAEAVSKGDITKLTEALEQEQQGA
jgi:hypothetical protein